MRFYLIHKNDLRCETFEDPKDASLFLWGKDISAWLLVKEGKLSVTLLSLELNALAAEIQNYLE